MAISEPFEYFSQKGVTLTVSCFWLKRANDIHCSQQIHCKTLFNYLAAISEDIRNLLLKSFNFG